MEEFLSCEWTPADGHEGDCRFEIESSELKSDTIIEANVGDTLTIRLDKPGSYLRGSLLVHQPKS